MHGSKIDVIIHIGPYGLLSTEYPCSHKCDLRAYALGMYTYIHTYTVILYALIQEAK